jgi:low temperature requirement protein LtrA
VVTHRKRWARLRRYLWQPPRAHGEQPHERAVGPLELFYDLAVVVLVAQDARQLALHLTWRGLGQFVAMFTLAWIAWVNGSLHHELHGHDDARGRSTFLLQILVLVAMGAFIPEADGARGAAFAVAAAVLFAVLTVLWLAAARGDRPEYRRPSRLFVTGTAACAVLLAGTAFLPASVRMPAWGLLDVAYLAGFTAILLAASPAQPAALAVTDALIDRFGQLTLIVLGETLTGIVSGLASQPVSGLTLSVGLVAVMVGFGAWWTYFDFAGNRHTIPVRTATLRWMLGHLPLTAAIAAMGAAMVSLVDHAHEGRTPAATGWVLSAGAAVVLCTTMLISASLQAWHRERGLYRPLARTCAAVAVACVAVGAARPAPLLLALALVLLLGIPWGLAVAHRLASAADLGRPPSAWLVQVIFPSGEVDRTTPACMVRTQPRHGWQSSDETCT